MTSNYDGMIDLESLLMLLILNGKVLKVISDQEEILNKSFRIPIYAKWNIIDWAFGMWNYGTTNATNNGTYLRNVRGKAVPYLEQDTLP